MFSLNRTYLWIATLTVVLALSTLGAVPHNVTTVPQSPLTENEDALLRDAKIYASNMGVSLDEAVNRFKLQEIAGNLEAEIYEKETETFAGLWLEHTPEFRLIVQFTRDGDETLKSYIPEELTGITEVRTAKVSLVNLEEIQKEVTANVREIGIEVESQVNVFENRVELFVIDWTRLDEAIQRGEVQLPANVEVIIVEKMGKLDADIYGGLALSQCTSGFSVRQTSDPGYKGITTAAHCANSLSYNGTSLTFMSQIFTGSYDIQWHRAPGFTVTNKIKDGSNTTRNITSTLHRNNQTIGGYVCKYGKATGYTCGYISSKTLCPSSVPNCGATFIRVDNTAGYSDLSSSGDSGGPWFLVNTAYGTHVGSPADDPNDAVYMAVNYIGGLGVSVMTSP